MKKIAKTDGFWWSPGIDLCYETKARKVVVDFTGKSLKRVFGSWVSRKVISDIK